MVTELKQKMPTAHQVKRLCQILEMSQTWYYQRPKAVVKQKAKTEKLASEIEQILATKAARATGIAG